MPRKEGNGGRRQAFAKIDIHAVSIFGGHAWKLVASLVSWIMATLSCDNKNQNTVLAIHATSSINTVFILMFSRLSASSYRPAYMDVTKPKYCLWLRPFGHNMSDGLGCGLRDGYNGDALLLWAKWTIRCVFGGRKILNSLMEKKLPEQFCVCVATLWLSARMRKHISVFVRSLCVRVPADNKSNQIWISFSCPSSCRLKTLSFVARLDTKNTA